MCSKNEYSGRCVLVFLKAPVEGAVKTRLSKVLDQEVVLNLYKNFVIDIVANLKNRQHTLKICYHPPHATAAILNWLGNNHSYLSQKGKNLGERMANAFAETFSDGFDKVVLIGSDLPDLPYSIINDAFNGLQNNSAVIGPAFDGGYYLIGFNNSTFAPEIFEDIPWGTCRVYEKTISIIEKLCLKTHILPQMRDIDEYEDLLNFLERISKSPTIATQTLKYLKQIQSLTNFLK